MKSSSCQFLKTLPMLALAVGLLLNTSRAADVPAPAPKQNSVYLFTSFRDADQKFLRFLYSFDGYHWTNVPGTFLKASAGPGGILRDPSLVRADDGAFHLVWTTAWHGDQGFGCASSSDLIHWSEQKFIPVMTNEPTTVNVWAPEIFYNEAAKNFLIVWASTIPGRFPDQLEKHDNNHRLYFTTTRDFTNFTPAKLFFEPGFSVIDGFVLQDGQRFVLLNKDNSRPNLNLRVAFADSPLGPWMNESAPFTQKFTEGPCALKVGDDWLIYFDAYREKVYGAVKTRDFKTFTDVTKEVSFPENHKHGTAIEVPREILDGLLKNAAEQELSESNYTHVIEGRADEVLKILALGDAGKAAAVRETIIAQYRGLRAWHDENDSQLKLLAKDTNAVAKIRASLKTIHDGFLARLAESLTPEQIEQVKDKMTYGKVQFTFAGYLAAYSTLSETNKQEILRLLKEAREEAMDGGSSDEKSAIFNRYKGKINNYLSKQGVHPDKQKAK